MGVGYTCQYCGQRADPLNYHEGPDDCRKDVQIPVTVWDGCYDGNWKGIITPESELDLPPKDDNISS